MERHNGTNSGILNNNSFDCSANYSCNFRYSEYKQHKLIEACVPTNPKLNLYWNFDVRKTFDYLIFPIACTASHSIF